MGVVGAGTIIIIPDQTRILMAVVEVMTMFQLAGLTVLVEPLRDQPAKTFLHTFVRHNALGDNAKILEIFNVNYEL